jgi:hypothetical protein
MEKFQTYKLEFGTFKKFENYIVGTPNRYANMGIPEAREINRVIGTQYTHNFGYIGDRVYSHSADPTVYLYANKGNTLLKSVAIVVYSEASRNIAELEEQAANTAGLNFAIFTKLDSAIHWTEAELEKLESTYAQ